MTSTTNLIRQVINKNEHKFPDQLREQIANFLKYSMTGYAHFHNCDDKLNEFMDFLAKPIKSPLLDKNLRTDSFFRDNFPTIQSNPLFGFFMMSMYNIKQKNYGAGEALLAMFFDDIQQAGKIGDFLRNGKHIEVKSVVSSASLKAHEDSSFRPSNKAFKKLYGEKKKGLTQLWEGDLKTFKQYFNILYPNFNSSLAENVYALPNEYSRRQHLGVEILREYKKIDNFDNLIVMKPSSDTDISFLNIVDFTDSVFIKNNIGFTPVLHRGRGTQALADGYVDIKLK